MEFVARELPVKRWTVGAWVFAAAAAIIFSHVITLAIAAGCLALAVLAATMGLGGIMLAAFGVVAGITILWSLIPRHDKFQQKGVLIDLSRQKRLSAEIETIAGAFGEPVPSEVYLILDANAFVTERGGWMGFGGRRVMGLGLPLMQALSISQFRAVLAHEFAHFYSGDTKLGPWVFKTRSAMGRVLTNLGKPSEILGFLRRWLIVNLAYTILIGGLVAYWKLFVRMTQLISRRQEFRCDELACGVAGSEALIGGLLNINKATAALRPYWQTVVLPVVAGGYQPLISDGFARFMNAPDVAKGVSAFLNAQMNSAKSDPLDTHPPLGARIEKARNLGATPMPVENTPFVSLVDDLSDLEKRLLQEMIPTAAGQLKPMDWDTAGYDVFVPMWQNRVSPFLPLLTGITVVTLPEALKGAGAIGPKIPDPKGMLLTRDQRTERATSLLTAAFTLALLEHGWRLAMQPGQFYVHREELNIQPGVMVARIKSGELSGDDWARYCSEAGIGDVPLDKFTFPSRIQEMLAK